MWERKGNIANMYVILHWYVYKIKENVLFRVQDQNVVSDDMSDEFKLEIVKKIFNMEGEYSEIFIVMGIY